MASAEVFTSTQSGVVEFTSLQRVGYAFTSDVRPAVVGPEPLYDPEWAPDGLRAAKPQRLLDYRDPPQYYPDASAFTASTKRWWQDQADLALLHEAAINARRLRPDGEVLETGTRVRLNPNPLNLSTSSYNNQSSATLGAAPGADDNFTPQLVVSGSNAAGIRQQNPGISLTAGDKVSMRALYKAGTSGEVRIVSRSTSGISYLDGLVNEPLPSAVNNGVIANDRLQQVGLLYQSTSTISILATQTDHRIGIGPSSSGTGNVTAYGVQWVKEPHAGEWIPPEITTTQGEVETYAVNGAAVHGLFFRGALTGWTTGETELVIHQLDTGDVNNRAAFVADAATLAVSAIVVVAGVTYTLANLGTLTMHQDMQLAMSWNDARVLIAQMNGNPPRTGRVPSAIPAFTMGRHGRNVTGGLANLFQVQAGAFDVPRGYASLQALLNDLAGEFDDTLVPMNIGSQVAQDTSEKVLGLNYDKDTASFFNGVATSSTFSLNRFAGDLQAFVAETRDGWQNAYDVVRPPPDLYLRSELHSVPDLAPAAIHMGFDVKLMDVGNALTYYEPGTTTRRTYSQAYIVQLKGSPDITGAPLFGLKLCSDGFGIIVGGADTIVGTDGNDRTDDFLPMVIRDGDIHRWQVEVVPSAAVAGLGSVRLYHAGVDGVYSLVWENLALWVGYPETTAVFYKDGLYCHANIGNMTVRFCNTEFATDLSWRRTRPRPLSRAFA